MQFSWLIFAAIVACVYAQVSISPGSPNNKWSKIARHPRDLSWNRNVGGGTLWGKLGTSDLTGSAGYKHDIFDNNRGVLQGHAQGTRDLLSDTSSIGGGLNWRNPQDTVRATLDVNKDIGGRTGGTLTGERAWKLDKDSHFVVGAGVSKTEGRQAEGQIKAEITKEW